MRVSGSGTKKQPSLQTAAGVQTAGGVQSASHAVIACDRQGQSGKGVGKIQDRVIFFSPRLRSRTSIQ